MWFRMRNAEFSRTSVAEKRAGLANLTEGELAPGLVGYLAGRAIGWVSFAPRPDYDRLTTAKVLAPVDGTPVWSIVCFVVSRSARGQGVARALLDAAMEFAREHGATMLEAYPVAATRGRVSAADAFHGSQSMFEKAGFSVVAVRRASPTSLERPIMRLALQPADAR